MTHRARLKRLLIYNQRFSHLLIAVGDCDPGYGSRVAAQEEKRDVARSGHQVDQHGHADSAQS